MTTSAPKTPDDKAFSRVNNAPQGSKSLPTKGEPLANHWVNTIGELVLMINEMKDISFLRVMEHPFLIVLNGTPKIGQNAQIVYIL